MNWKQKVYIGVIASFCVGLVINPAMTLCVFAVLSFLVLAGGTVGVSLYLGYMLLDDNPLDGASIRRDLRISLPPENKALVDSIKFSEEDINKTHAEAKSIPYTGDKV